jgi:hypothetical protein
VNTDPSIWTDPDNGTVCCSSHRPRPAEIKTPATVPATPPSTAGGADTPAADCCRVCTKPFAGGSVMSIQGTPYHSV